MNVLVADSVTHANALIRWLVLDEDSWIGAAYGKPLKSIYERAILARPLSGVTEEHTDWILGHLIPRIVEAKGIATVPPEWKPGREEIPAGPAEFEPQTLWAS